MLLEAHVCLGFCTTVDEQIDREYIDPALYVREGLPFFGVRSSRRSFLNHSRYRRVSNMETKSTSRKNFGVMSAHPDGSDKVSKPAL